MAKATSAFIKWNAEVENAKASLEKWKQEVKEKRNKKAASE